MIANKNAIQLVMRNVFKFSPSNTYNIIFRIRYIIDSYIIYMCLWVCVRVFFVVLIKSIMLWVFRTCIELYLVYIQQFDSSIWFWLYCVYPLFLFSLLAGYLPQIIDLKCSICLLCVVVVVVLFWGESSHLLSCCLFVSFWKMTIKCKRKCNFFKIFYPFW